MSFLFPLALLGLLAIPALIIIYILRNKYKEETAPSTYIWEVAAKLLKRKNPLSRFEHLLALIVQCLAIAVFSIALAHPVFTLKEQADDIVFILDSSSSMSMVHEEQTRFEKGVELIREKAKEAVNGSTFTLLLADAEPRLVCQKIDDFSRFEMYLDSVKVTESTSLISDALSVAQNLYSNGEANRCFLVTDQKCESLTNIELLDCSDDEQNYAITELSYKLPKDTFGRITFQGTAYSYASDKELEVTFLVNGNEVGTMKCACTAGVPFAFSSEQFNYDGGRAIENIKAVIKEEDGLMADNSFTVYKNNSTINTKALIVSARPTYLEKIFKALKVDFDVIAPQSYRQRIGYDIYVFDSYTPKSLPEEGASMFFGLQNNVQGIGFNVSHQIDAEAGTKLAWADNSENSLFRTLTRGIGMNRDINIDKYQSYALINDFTTVLTVNRRPAVFVGRSEFETREVVFSFDLHDTDLPLIYDFVPLMRNLIDFCKPRTLLNFQYEVGDKVTLNIADEITKIVVTKPNGTTEPLNWNGNEQYIYETSSIGEHLITCTYQDGSTKEISFFAAMNAPEQNPQPDAPVAYSLAVTDNTKKGDGILDNLLPIIIAAAAFFAADWILYTHEQY